jgi:hypothetical protein
MNFGEMFHGVKSGTPAQKLAFWDLCKEVASVDPRGMAVGLSKIAYQIWADHYDQGVKMASSQESREAFAASFGSAVVVDLAIEKMAEANEIDAIDCAKMRGWVAESAIDDLSAMTKSAAGFMDFIKRPEVIGAIGGMALGAGIGAAVDKENRARGAIYGAVPGAIIGAMGGHDFGAHQANKIQEAASQSVAHAQEVATAAQKAKEVAHRAAGAQGLGQRYHDAMMHAASAPAVAAGKPELAKVLAANKNKIIEHYGSGHTHLPEFLHDALGSASERLAFGNVITRMAKKGSLNQKLADVLQGVEYGGQPPMNADNSPPDQQAAANESLGAPQPDAAVDSLSSGQEGQQVVDNMIFLAQQVQQPELAQTMEGMREALAKHFSEGNAYLPRELQAHFPQSEHAETFMKKYKQRFGPIKGSKKTAAEHDWFSWRAQR